MSPQHTETERRLRLEQQPASPTYMSYVFQVPEQISPAAPPRTNQQPAMNETWNTIRFNDTGSAVYEHFHSPWNDHNKFLSSAKDADRYAYRDLPRMAPPPFDKSGRSSIRPQSAGPRLPSQRRSASPPRSAHATAMNSDAMSERIVTATGIPCYNASVILAADLEAGAPVLDPSLVGEDTWRLARVQTYDVPPSPVGYGEGGKRPFHQDYAHYKYYGFAGKGGKTSWAYNPKQAESWRATRPSSAARRPGSSVPRQPGQPMTLTEAKLVAKHPQHGYARANRPPIEILDPYTEHASVVTRQPLSPQEVADKSRRRDKVKVATYRQPVPGELTLAENPSPNHGSQSPFHQRYAHYKLHGFAGQGATSSWARNPKLALLYDS